MGEAKASLKMLCTAANRGVISKGNHLLRQED
jgi:hypothetical protein